MTVIYLNKENKECVKRNVIKIQYIGGEFEVCGFGEHSSLILKYDELLTVID